MGSTEHKFAMLYVCKTETTHNKYNIKIMK